MILTRRLPPRPPAFDKHRRSMSLINRQEELEKQRNAASKEQQAQSVQLQAKYNNIQALTDHSSDLQRQEQNLLVRIGKVEKSTNRCTAKVAFPTLLPAPVPAVHRSGRSGATRSSR